MQFVFPRPKKRGVTHLLGDETVFNFLTLSIPLYFLEKKQPHWLAGEAWSVFAESILFSKCPSF
jgi:hypothetical protein